MDGDTDIGVAFLPPVKQMSLDQLSQLYHAMFMVSVPDETVEAALTKICGSMPKFASRAEILPVLQEIHDRRGDS